MLLQKGRSVYVIIVALILKQTVLGIGKGWILMRDSKNGKATEFIGRWLPLLSYISIGGRISSLIVFWYVFECLLYQWYQITEVDVRRVILKLDTFYFA